MTYYTRTLGTAFSLSGISLANLSGLGFTEGGDNISTSGVAHPFNVTGNGVTSILLGAKRGNTDALDYFKITSMNASTSGVPEPSTMGMLGVALVGLGMLGKFRRAAKR